MLKLLCTTLLKNSLVRGLSTLKFKFLSDEDVDARFIKSLSDSGIDIRYADKGIRNSKLYSLACKEGKAILSFDKDFLNTSLFPPAKLPAVLIIHVHPPSTSKYESLFLQWLNKFSDESIGNTWILAEDGIRIID